MPILNFYQILGLHVAELLALVLQTKIILEHAALKKSQH